MTMAIYNAQLAARRQATIVKGSPKFARRSYGVACVQDGAFIHLESFYGFDGRSVRAKAERYRAQYLAGVDLGLNNSWNRMSLTSGFASAVNVQAIAAIAPGFRSHVS